VKRRSTADDTRLVFRRHIEFRRPVSTFVPAEFGFFLLEPGQLFVHRLHKALARRYRDLRVSHHRPQCWLAPLDPTQIPEPEKVHDRKITGF